jgi:hypothetical protein
MELELHIIEVEPERRWNWWQWFDSPALGRFLSYEDQSTLVLLREPGQPLPSGPHVRNSTVIRLAPAIGSTVTTSEQLARMNEPVLELRRYRLRPGTRARFAAFFRDRTLAEQVRLGMNVHSPFDVLDDETTLVWFRGFPSLPERDRRKASFYQSRYWLEELQDEAFSMIEDYSVILMAPM